MTQKDMVLDYIKQNGSITTNDAIYGMGITRLSDVIFRLKKDGYEFNTVIERSVNRFGNKTEYARYSLKDML